MNLQRVLGSALQFYVVREKEFLVLIPLIVDSGENAPFELLKVIGT